MGTWIFRKPCALGPCGFIRGGGKRDRTADLLHAMQALSQLSYTPTKGAHYTGGISLCKEWENVYPG